MLQGDPVLYLDTNPVVYLLPDRRHRFTAASKKSENEHEQLREHTEAHINITGGRNSH